MRTPRFFSIPCSKLPFKQRFKEQESNVYHLPNYYCHTTGSAVKKQISQSTGKTSACWAQPTRRAEGLAPASDTGSDT